MKLFRKKSFIFFALVLVCGTAMSQTTTTDSAIVYNESAQIIRYTITSQIGSYSNGDSLYGRSTSTKKRSLVSPLDLPISSATQTALDAKQNTLGPGSVTNTMLAGSIAASKLIGTDINTVGTISTGTWNATRLTTSYIPQISTSRLWGRTTSSTGNIEEIAIISPLVLSATSLSMPAVTSSNDGYMLAIDKAALDSMKQSTISLDKVYDSLGWVKSWDNLVMKSLEILGAGTVSVSKTAGSSHNNDSTLSYTITGTSGGLAIGDPITDATNGYFLYPGTNGNLQQTNTFFHDSTTERYGIGNLVPLAKLDLLAINSDTLLAVRSATAISGRPLAIFVDNAGGIKTWVDYTATFNSQYLILRSGLSATQKIQFGYDGVQYASDIGLAFSSTTDRAGSKDWGISRGAPGIGYLGNGTTGNVTGGMITGTIWARVRSSDVSLSNSSTSAQNIFASANDVLTVSASTTYYFEATLYVATGTTTHTTAFGFGGTASFTSIKYFSQLNSGTSGTISTTAPSQLDVTSASATILNATSASAFTIIRVKGIMEINAGGTIIPQITFSAGPTGTCAVKIGSYIKLTPWGNTSTASIGDWN